MTSRSEYDRIAHLYDADMARNMAFDDVSCYANLAQRAAGPVLELGCGNGRILLPLLARGIDAIGIDRSAGMLEQLRNKSALQRIVAPICQMDARRLAFGCGFASVLCPYSLVTYMAESGEAAQMLAEAARVLTPGGTLVVDAFIPRETISSDAFRLDYQRPLGDAVLARSKRVTVVAPGVNKIERRYDVLAPNGAFTERVETVERIRTFLPDELTALMRAAGLSIEQTLWDYGDKAHATDAQFCTLVGRKGGTV